MNRIKLVLLVITSLSVGVALGAYLFSDTRPRPFLSVHNCEGGCIRPNELVGLLASVGLQRFPGLVPDIVKETDKTIVVEQPGTHTGIHYLVIPKKDIRNAADLSDSDREYLVDLFTVMGEIIRERHLTDYQIMTNGPGYQTVAYLHFHLVAREPR
jgi:hypothetical protein